MFDYLDLFDVPWYDKTAIKLRKRFDGMQPDKFEEPKYSKKQIARAGKMLADAGSLQNAGEALAILANWRAAHAYPLSVIATRLFKSIPDALVVQRLKRLDSIWGKLKRFPDMNLARMQDLGGCRAIVGSTAEVYETVERYKSAETTSILKHEYDYIKNPKVSGYRSYHVVYQFQDPVNPAYNSGILIEMQIRTQLQHVWATALEVMGIYTKLALKSGYGEPDILRFFVLMSSVFALNEGTPVCPGTSSDFGILAAEVAELNSRHGIIDKLLAVSVVIRHAKECETKGGTEGYHVLLLDCNKSTLSTYHYSKDELAIATETYNHIEARNDPNINVVLVAADSLNTVREAYPNYFIDTTVFVRLARKVIAYGNRINSGKTILTSAEGFIGKLNM